jgi:hypothetical protein
MNDSLAATPVIVAIDGSATAIGAALGDRGSHQP